MKLRSTPEAPAPADRSAIRTEDLTVVLGATPVLRGVDLAVAEGEAVALMGGNGSGKSTLIKSLLGIVPVDSGEARLFGADVTGAKELKLLSKKTARKNRIAANHATATTDQANADQQKTEATR